MLAMSSTTNMVRVFAVSVHTLQASASGHLHEGIHCEAKWDHAAKESCGLVHVDQSPSMEYRQDSLSLHSVPIGVVVLHFESG